MLQPTGNNAIQGLEQLHVQAGTIQALQMQREMISEQYQRVMAERGRVGQERMNAQARGDAGMVKEYDGVMARLGARMLDLEKSLQKADQRIDEAMKSPITEIVVPGGPGEPIAIADAPPPTSTTLSVPVDELISQRIEFQRIMAAEAVGLLLLGALLWRFGFVRGKRAAAAQQIAPVDTARDERMQQAIDAIAIEVERLSEGQRFTNTLLSSKRHEREALPVTPNRITTPNDGTRITPH